MSGTNNNSTAAPPSYLDKAVHSIVGNLTGTHDDKETTSKPQMPKASSACAPAMDTECAMGKTTIKAMKDTDGSISMSNTVEEVIDMANGYAKAVETCDVMKFSADSSMSTDADEASKKVSLEGSKACSMVVENVNKAEAAKDMTQKPLDNAKLMDGACDTKSEKKMGGACGAKSEKKMDGAHNNKVWMSEKKIDGEEKSVEKMDHKMHHNKMNDEMNDEMDSKMDHKMDSKNTDQKLMNEEKMGGSCAEKQAVGHQMQKTDEVCEMGACVKTEEPKTHGYASSGKASHATGEMCSKMGGASCNTEC